MSTNPERAVSYVLKKFVTEYTKLKEAHAKLSEMLNNQISEVEGKLVTETEKIKEMMGLIEKAKKEPKEKKADKKDAPKADKKEEPKEVVFVPSVLTIHHEGKEYHPLVVEKTSSDKIKINANYYPDHNIGVSSYQNTIRKANV